MIKKEEFRQLIRQSEPHKKLLFNKLTYTIVIVLVLSAGAQAYVAQNNDGQISGTVVDQNGDPIEDATIQMDVIPLSGVTDSESTTTNAQGEFEFTREDILEFRITVLINAEEKHTKEHHLLFRGQNTELQIELDTTID
ncbi:carboxypeptidase-like regulatory domain-containing protein [Natrialba sp. INN-245]|uniref:carboxypeptidase-like regulatory domain-containing protein n=1 Tax=Natrialba sp. INN-245 TaxID=2690967 RepID=UPI001310D97D|nr:carboxypeptidase-like regulatory domain-containing protein [Natrialba sp. INN-245]MWV38848.1 hypothetical protein [Natrialba sp. INN-245]